jgi:hypothetical protein
MTAAVAATATASAKLRREEEEMTLYATNDLAADWEFKILRSATGRFRNPSWLRRILEEEARAGWKLVEKFDNSRVRLKRPASARVSDAALGFDPYRSWVGISQARFAALLVLGLLASAVAIVVLVFLTIATLTSHNVG